MPKRQSDSLPSQIQRHGQSDSLPDSYAAAGYRSSSCLPDRQFSKAGQVRNMAAIKKGSRKVVKGNLELDMLVERFQTHNRSDGKSPKTVEWYSQALDLFLEWLRAEGMSTCVDDLGEDEVRNFVLYLQGRRGLWGLASSHTLNNRVRALRAFFNWLYRQGYTECHRLQNLKVPKVRQKEIEVLTDEEIERIFATMNAGTVLGARNRALYSLMLDTGLRLTEVVTLKHGDVHLDKRYVKVLGKGDKERIVAFGTNCKKSLATYATRYRFPNEGESTDAFFLSIDGYCMSPDALRSLTERLSKAAGIPRLHPHLMRHTYATRFLLNGGNVFLLQQNLGHTTLVMVQKYLHIANRMAAQVSQDFSPLDHVEMRAPSLSGRSFNGDNWSGRIYPNAGRSQGRGAVPRNPNKKR